MSFDSFPKKVWESWQSGFPRSVSLWGEIYFAESVYCLDFKYCPIKLNYI